MDKTEVLTVDDLMDNNHGLLNLTVSFHFGGLKLYHSHSITLRHRYSTCQIPPLCLFGDVHRYFKTFIVYIG